MVFALLLLVVSIAVITLAVTFVYETRAGLHFEQALRRAYQTED